MESKIMKYSLCQFGIILMFFLALYSCNFNSTNYNEEAEKNKAIAIADKLYLNIQNDNYADIENLFSQAFYDVNTKEDLHNTLANTKKTLGTYKNKELIDWKTATTQGSNPASEYLLIYNVTYTKFSAKESLTLKEESGKIKIVGYNIHSDGFLKK